MEYGAAAARRGTPETAIRPHLSPASTPNKYYLHLFLTRGHCPENPLKIRTVG